MPEPTPHPVAPPEGRYGPPATAGRRRARLLAVVVTAAAGLALVLSIGLHAARDPVSWNDVGFTLQGADRVQVVYDVIRPDPSVAVRCRLHALSQGYAEVGVLVVDISPADSRVQRFASTVATSEPAVTGVVDSCWVP